MDIPVYNLTGIDENAMLGSMFSTIKKKVATAAKAKIKTKAPAKNTKKIFTKVASAVTTPDAAVKVVKKATPSSSAIKVVKVVKTTSTPGGVVKAVQKGGMFANMKSKLKKHKKARLQGMDGIDGVYNDFLKKVGGGQSVTDEEIADFKKAKVLKALETEDYDGFRLAGLAMPYVLDIDDNDGGYYFENGEIAGIFADAENELNADPNMPELGKLKIFKKVKNAVKKVAKTVAKAAAAPVKAVAKTTAAAVKSAANVVKATANVVKAGAQAATGNTAKAKATIKKAGQQAKAAVVQPVKTVAQQTKAVVKATVVDPTKLAVQAAKNTIKIAGKVFKVIFVKINPVTVLMRNSLRALVAINFLGMATKLNVANLTKEQAIAQGYTAEQYADAQKAKKRVVNFFVKMGGKEKNIEKAIINGSKKKALFKGSYSNNTKLVDNGEDDAQLGFEPGSIGAALASVGAFFAKIWNWIKGIIPKVANVAKKVIEKVGTNKGAAADETQYAAELPPENTDNEEKKKFPWWIIAAGGAAVLLLATKKK